MLKNANSSSLHNTSLLNHTQRGILCFGDSLTKGLLPEKDDWQKYHPYSIQLLKQINNHYNNNTNVKVIDDGINGEQLSHMKYRITGLLSKSLYDIVIVLGGTNDLGHYRSSDQILTDLYEIYHSIYTFGLKSNRTIVTIAMTIPPLQWPVDQNVRTEVNNALREYVTKNITRTYLCDIDKVLVTTGTKYYCPDNVHFSAIGYDLIGDLVYYCLKENYV